MGKSHLFVQHAVIATHGVHGASESSKCLNYPCACIRYPIYWFKYLGLPRPKPSSQKHVQKTPTISPSISKLPQPPCRTFRLVTRKATSLARPSHHPSTPTRTQPVRVDSNQGRVSPPITTQHADSPESGGTRSEFQQKKGISRELTGERLGSSSGSWVFRSNNSREEEGGGLRVFLSFSSSSTTSPHPSKVKLRRSSTMKRSASIPEREENGTFKKGSQRVFLRLV